jgi:hypothetical protein
MSWRAGTDRTAGALSLDPVRLEPVPATLSLSWAAKEKRPAVASPDIEEHPFHWTSHECILPCRFLLSGL